MIEAITVGLRSVCLLLAAVGCIYSLCAAAVVGRFRSDGKVPLMGYPGVTILKPLAGTAPGLYEDLASFCNQDYHGPVQLLFGVQDSADAAVPVIERLIKEHPGRELELVVHADKGRQNPKVANLIGLEGCIRHEIVILADADIGVASDYLSSTVAALELPNVGAVTCLYRGVARVGVWSELASMGIDYHFLPGVLVGLKLDLATPCFGSTIALRRDVLSSIGGFRSFVDYIADDYAMGEAIRAAGMKVAIPSLILAHSCSEQSVGELLRHELRWARTVRAVSPLGYAGSVVTHPLPFALLTAALGGFGASDLMMIAGAFFCRLVLQRQVDHTLRVSSKRWWFGPVRDLLTFGVYVASYFVKVVSWRGQHYRVRRDGTLTAVGEPKA